MPSSLSRHLWEGPSLTEEGANQGKTAEQGTEPQTPSRQAGELGSSATTSRCSTTPVPEPFGAAHIYLGWPRREKSWSSDLEVAFSR